VKEILAVGKLCYEVRERHYDLVIVDAEASGHVVSQIGAPKVIADLVQVGLVKDQTQWMLDILEDPARTGVAVVTTPEEMPVTESIELLEKLTAETGTHPAAVVANRVLPAMFNRRELPIARRLREALPILEAAIGPGAGAVIEAGTIVESRRSIGAAHLDRLRAAIGDAGLTVGDEPLPIVTVPELFGRSHGPRVVSLVANALRDELDA
jgi:anion-transporting  ArsA/GET3 family ATPase